MTFDNIILTRLEWDRLIGCGWLRLQTARLVRVHDWLDPISATVNFETLMGNAPDVGINSSDYVLAELHYGIWQPISKKNFQLGRIIKLEQVRHFSCFDERSCEILNANYKGVEKYKTKIFEQPKLWLEWREKIFKAWEENRSQLFLTHFKFSSQKIVQESRFVFEEIIKYQNKLLGNRHYEHAKGTRAFGWITTLAISKQNPELAGCATEADPAIRIMIESLQKDYRVDTPFFSDQSISIANYVLNDRQYNKISKELVIFAAYTHYAYLIERSGHKKFNYDEFCKDIAWLEEKNIYLAVQLVDKIARYMVDELLWSVVSSHTPILPQSALEESTRIQENLSINVIAPTSEKSTASLTAIYPCEDRAPQVGTTEAVAHLPEDQDITRIINEEVELPKAPTESFQAIAAHTSDELKTIEPEVDKGESKECIQVKVIDSELSSLTGLDVKNNNIQASLIPDPELTSRHSTSLPITEITSTSKDKSKKTRKYFKEEMKKEILKMARKYGVDRVCKDNEITKDTLKRWAKKLDPDFFSQI